MSVDETDVVERLHALAAAIELSPVPVADDVRRGRRRVRRNRAMVGGAAAACVALVLGVTAAVGGPDRADSDSGPEPVEPPVVVASEAVWYDQEGLHRGDVVEQTPVEPQSGTLALVRSGALYTEEGYGDVWFHPWGGEPRIVGHNSMAGPGADPNGDTAAWFDRNVLVVYDTAADRVISKTEQKHSVRGCPGMCAEHYPSGNWFLQVSAERVVWTLMHPSADAIFSFDVRTRTTSEIQAPTDLAFVDVQDQIKILRPVLGWVVIVRVPGQADQSYNLMPRAKVSPSGNYLLTVEETPERFGAAIVDLRTGEVWRVPPAGYPWIAWSSGDIAMIDIETALLACDPTRQSCEPVPTNGRFLMPIN